MLPMVRPSRGLMCRVCRSCEDIELGSHFLGNLLQYSRVIAVHIVIQNMTTDVSGISLRPNAGKYLVWAHGTADTPTTKLGAIRQGISR